MKYIFYYNGKNVKIIKIFYHLARFIIKDFFIIYFF